MSDAPLSAYDAYRAGYYAGYFRGRLAQMNGEDYDARTPVEREGNGAVTYGDPWDNEEKELPNRQR
ncbi:hypothetical protein [Paenibacillus planticolens]|uniref:Uncharacterized protein n=1 Tax=Paenibacillus planticolens TaxID=2654976 RepID=A0ABX1ZEE4_9BACL|nr:hypothetical protein [Paenibacillus planticolens]NOU98464.1 hypothetical protein [Paenibacillus planticolens]